MPTYEYKCKKCHETFEYFQSMKDEKLTVCPKCKGELKRLIGSGSPPIFKGSGFYATDYKKTSSKPDTKAGKKADTKPATPAKTEKPKGSDSAKKD
ncbi:MAG: FmdB family zinc ribbon protein [Ignavibacteriaceae bacterium]